MDAQDHPIRIEAAAGRWRAQFAGHVIADSDQAIVLHEAGHGPVVYFPRQDVAMEYFSRADKVTHCPCKGAAAHYSILMDGHFAEAWSYESPNAGCDQITERIAFYPDKVEVYEVSDAAVNPHHHEPRTVASLDVDEVVRHTDAGDGHSQAEHWAPNVETPNPDGGVR